MTRTRLLLGALLPLLAGGCATSTAEMSMPNPALSGDKLQATQSYEIPPYRGDHRYEATLEKWTPAALEFRLHFLNAEDCGLPASYTFALVDDRGRRYAFQPEASEQLPKAAGHLGTTLFEGAETGTFPVTVGAQTRFVTLEIRPRGGRSCSALNFRWNFKS